MTDNPDAVKHEGLARESAELRPPEEFAHLPFHSINRTRITILDSDGTKPRIEPMMWNGHAWWTIASTRTETPADAFAAGWRYHGPWDPDAVILNSDDKQQAYVVAQVSKDRMHGVGAWSDLWRKAEFMDDLAVIEIDQRLMQARAVIRALRGMRR